MTPGFTIAVILFQAVLAALAATGYARSRIRRRRAELDSLVASLNERAEAQTAVIAELDHHKHTLETKLTNTQKHIATTLSQRDFWNEWYHRQVSEHGAAQHFMLTEIELHVKRGSKHPVNPLLKEIVQDFKDVHPAMADQGRPAREGDKPLAER